MTYELNIYIKPFLLGRHQLYMFFCPSPPHVIYNFIYCYQFLIKCPSPYMSVRPPLLYLLYIYIYISPFLNICLLWLSPSPRSWRGILQNPFKLIFLYLIVTKYLYIKLVMWQCLSRLCPTPVPACLSKNMAFLRGANVRPPPLI